MSNNIRNIRNIRIATPATPEMARQFRIACAVAGRRQSEVLRELIQRWVSSQSTARSGGNAANG